MKVSWNGVDLENTTHSKYVGVTIDRTLSYKQHIQNPDKTQVTAFHLRNREAKRSLKVSWNGVDLENTTHSKYVGVTIDRTLSYKQHIQNTKMKVATRNNHLKKLAKSKSGTNASTIRTTALALCYSIAEYAAPVWARSTYADILDPELNKACRAITGCLKPTYVEDLYLLAGLAPPDIRRDVLEWNKPNRWNKRLILCLVTSQQEAA